MAQQPKTSRTTPPPQTDETLTPMDRLLSIMARLRDPECGCPWDVKQTFSSLAPYTIEEAYEVTDAIRTGDRAALKDELGDLLLQVVFLSRLAEEEKAFTFEDVVTHLAQKLVRRHPHVFAGASAKTATEVDAIWEAQKRSEKSESTQGSLLDGVGRGLPAFIRALKLQKRAITARWDWATPSDVLGKLDEEIAELREALSEKHRDAVEDELGDVFFVAVNVARKLEMDSETALARACDKFERRFRRMETILKAHHDRPLVELDDAAMNWGWTQAKKETG